MMLLWCIRCLPLDIASISRVFCLQLQLPKFTMISEHFLIILFYRTQILRLLKIEENVVTKLSCVRIFYVHLHLHHAPTLQGLTIIIATNLRLR